MPWHPRKIYFARLHPESQCDVSCVKLEVMPDFSSASADSGAPETPQSVTAATSPQQAHSANAAHPEPATGAAAATGAHSSQASEPASVGDEIIRFDAVSKIFGGRGSRSQGSGVAALSELDLSIRRGEIFAVIGYSGAGKSTLVRLINGLEKVSSGTVTVDGTVVSGLGERQLSQVRENIGMVFQQFNLLRSRTVFGNIEFPLRVAKWEKAEREERVWELLDFVGLTEKAWAYPEELSGGQRQRVGIARAIAARPAVLLADEATSALDPETTADVLALLRRTNRELGVTVVVITHEMEVVRALADRVAVLDAGRVVEVGSTFDVFANPQSDRAQAFLATVVHNVPNDEQLTTLRERGAERGEERLFTVNLHDGIDIGALLSRVVANHGVEFSLAFGGVDLVQGKQFGSITFGLRGEGIEAALAELRVEASIEEVAA